MAVQVWTSCCRPLVLFWLNGHLLLWLSSPLIVVLVQIPLDVSIRETCDAGAPIVASEPGSAVAQVRHTNPSPVPMHAEHSSCPLTCSKCSVTNNTLVQAYLKLAARVWEKLNS